MRGKRRFVLGAIVTVLAIAACLPFLVSAAPFRGVIEAAATRAIGRDVRITGDMGFTFYPEVGISARDVRMANMPGVRHPEMVSVERLIVGAKFWPLLSGRLEVTRLHLENPVFHLETNGSGIRNWELVAPEQQQASGGETGAHEGFGLRDVRVTGGTITYDDATTQKSLTFSDVGVAFDFAGLDQPIAIDGSATYNGEKLNLKAELDGLSAMVSDQGTPTKLAVTSPLLTAIFDGVLSTSGETRGTLKVDAPSFRRIATWAGYTMGNGQNFGPLAFDGNISRTPNHIAFTRSIMTLDAVRMAGDLTVDSSDDLPNVTGALGIEGLKLDAYTANSASAQEQNEPSNTPLDFSALKSANAELTLRLSKFVASRLTVDAANVNLTLKNGLLSAALRDVVFYGGKGTGTLVIDGAKDVPELAARLSVADMNMQPFLRDSLRVDRISGSGGLELEVSARAATEKGIYETLSGEASMSLADGDIRGVDLTAVPRIVKNLIATQQTGIIGDDAKTPYDRMSLAFTLLNGVAHSDNFKLEGPQFQVTGAGEIDIARRTLDFHLETRTAAATILPGSRVEMPPLGVPFRVHGNWDRLSYGPDVGRLTRGLMDAIARDPSRIIENPGEALQSLFGLGR